METKDTLVLKDLFYSSTERILFWIAGYTQIDNTDHVVTQINALNDYIVRFAGVTGCSLDRVYSRQVQTSRRYKYCRVFWIRNADPIEGAFVFTSEPSSPHKPWTMDQWLEN